MQLIESFRKSLMSFFAPTAEHEESDAKEIDTYIDAFSHEYAKECYCNRELSWLKFNKRVLMEAGNASVPLGERLSFISIYQTNLDEFFQVRVGSLMDQKAMSETVRENKTYMTSEEQIKAVLKQVRLLDKEKNKIWNGILSELEEQDVHIVNFKKVSKEEEKLIEAYFDAEISPYLSPMVVGKQQAFPFMKDKELYAIILLTTKGGKSKMGVIPSSNNIFNRLIELPTRPNTFMLSEELILHFAPKIYKKYRIEEKSLVRVIRNADISPDMIDEDLSYIDIMEKLVKQRKRLQPVKVEFSRKLNEEVVSKVCEHMDFDTDHAFMMKTPLDFAFVKSIRKVLDGKPDMFYPQRSPRLTPVIDMSKSIIRQVSNKDVLLSYPFESIRPFTALLEEAAKDPSVVSIKMTLYRLASGSQIIKALMDALDNGKEVEVVVELRARFDEQNNIEWARKLEVAGARVIYGLGKYKVHSKLCLITRKTVTGISYITQIGTGNYNENTAELYTDLCLMTGNKEIGVDAANTFNSLMMGETVRDTKHLLVAPHCLQNRVLNMIDEQIALAREGGDGYIGIKMNSVTDKAILNKLIEASCAGVKIDMIVRGICCITPRIEGYTENMNVISIVGRFLEHSRIYIFGKGEREKIYIASADFMTRNTLRRVEVAAPILDPEIREKIKHIFNVALADNVKGKMKMSDGYYMDIPQIGQAVNSQEIFYEEAYEASTQQDNSVAIV